MDDTTSGDSFDLRTFAMNVDCTEVDKHSMTIETAEKEMILRTIQSHA